MINNITKHFLFKQTQNTRIPLSSPVLLRSTPVKWSVTNVKLQNQQISSINKILEAFFKKFLILISKPVYTNTPNGIKISLLYFIRLNASSSKKNKKTVVNRRKSSARWALKQKQANDSLKKGLVQKVYWNKFMSNIPQLGLTPIVARPKYNKFSRARLTFLVLLLSKLLKTNVQIELVRIKYVYHDSNILAQFLGINSHRVTYGRIKNLLWNRVTTLHQTSPGGKDTANNTLSTGVNGTSLSNTIISKDDFSPVTSLTGFKIKISGRLAKQRVVPKKTVKTTYKGAISPNKYNLVDEASYTGKNKKGAYTIRVWTSHGITS